MECQWGTFDLNNTQFNVTNGGTINIAGGSVTNATEVNVSPGGSFEISAGTLNGGEFESNNNDFVTFSGGTTTLSSQFWIGNNVGTSVALVTGGSITANSLNLQSFNIAGRVGILRFGAGSGSFSAGSVAFNNNADSHIDFLAGTGGSLTITRASLSTFQGYWDNDNLWFDGQSKTALGGLAFADTDFQVTGSTLTVIPEPGSTALLAGAATLGLLLLRRRRN